MFVIAPSFGNLVVYFLVASVVTLILFCLPKILAPTSFSTEKLSAYECGFEPFLAPREVFESHFIVVAVLFIIFDLELIFLFPWAASAASSGYGGFWAMMGFLLILTFGLVYEWMRGALT